MNNLTAHSSRRRLRRCLRRRSRSWRTTSSARARPTRQPPRTRSASGGGVTAVTNLDWALGLLELLALLCFPIFVIVLAWILQRADGGRTWLPWAVLSFGLVSAAVKIASGTAIFALAWRADNGISDGLAAALVDMNGAAFMLTWALDAVMLAAAGGRHPRHALLCRGGSAGSLSSLPRCCSRTWWFADLRPAALPARVDLDRRCQHHDRRSRRARAGRRTGGRGRPRSLTRQAAAVPNRLAARARAPSPPRPHDHGAAPP